MAPTKKDGDVKEKKLTPDESSKLILEYLRSKNRPYSATDISTNLNNRVTKAAATKLLKDMHERKDIDGKASGKQIVYFSVQDEMSDDFEEAMLAKQAKIEEYREAITTLKNQEKEYRLALRSEATTVTLPELQASVDKLEKDKAELMERLEKLKSGCVKPVDPEKKARLIKECKKWSKIAMARKKIRSNLWGEIADAVGKDKEAETKEVIGIEGPI